MNTPHIDGEQLKRRASRLNEDRDQLLSALIRLRRDHQLTQREIAERMGVSQPTVAAFEHYDANPTISTIHRYAMAVGAVLDTHVLDDCGEGVPSDWSRPLEQSIRVKAPQRPSVPTKFRETTYVS